MKSLRPAACRCTTSSMMASGTLSRRSTSAIRRLRFCAPAASPSLGVQRDELELQRMVLCC